MVSYTETCCHFSKYNNVTGRNLSPHSVWVWSFDFTQTCISVLLLFGPWGY